MGDSWAAYFPMDGYHLSNAQLKRLGLLDRKGAPNTFDIDGYVAMLSRMAAEGNYLGLDEPGWRDARRLIDHLWYVDAAGSLRKSGCSPGRSRAGTPD
jgi:pantothenate kinase